MATDSFSKVLMVAIIVILAIIAIVLFGIFSQGKTQPVSTYEYSTVPTQQSLQPEKVVEKIVYQPQPTVTAAVVESFPYEKWKPSGSCLNIQISNMASLDRESFPGSIDPVDVIGQIDWFDGRVNEKALLGIRYSLDNLNGKIYRVDTIKSGTLDKVIFSNGGCSENVPIGKWSKVENVYSVYVENPVLEEKSQLFFFGNKEDDIVAIGYASSIYDVESTNFHIPGSSSDGGSVDVGSGGSSSTSSSPTTGGGGVLGGSA